MSLNNDSVTIWAGRPKKRGIWVGISKKSKPKSDPKKTKNSEIMPKIPNK